MVSGVGLATLGAECSVPEASIHGGEKPGSKGFPKRNGALRKQGRRSCPPPREDMKVARNLKLQSEVPYQRVYGIELAL